MSFSTFALVFVNSLSFASFALVSKKDLTSVPSPVTVTLTIDFKEPAGVKLMIFTEHCVTLFASKNKG